MSQPTTQDLILDYIRDYTARNDGPPDTLHIVLGVAADNPLSAAHIQSALHELEHDKRVLRNIWGYFRINEEEQSA